VAWIKTVEDGEFLMLHDLGSGETRQITDGGHAIADCQVSGDIVVWADNRHGNADIFMYDIASGETRQLTSHYGNEHLFSFHDDVLVYNADGVRGYPDVYMMDVVTGEEGWITSGLGTQSDPSIHGDRVVYCDYVHERGCDLFMFNLTSGDHLRITTSAAYSTWPEIGGDVIVWHDDRHGNWDVYMHDLRTGDEWRLTHEERDQTRPQVWGDLVIWSDEGQLFLHDALTGREYELDTGGRYAAGLSIFRDRIIFQSGGHLEPDLSAVFLLELKLDPLRYPPTTPSVRITHPSHGEVCRGTVPVTGTAWDDLDVERVEVRVDGGEWRVAEGTTSWTFQLDTTRLGASNHTLEARSFDGGNHSFTRRLTFVVERAPWVTVAVPREGQMVNGTVDLSGKASTDPPVDSVQWRIDGGEWSDASGTADWSTRVDTTALPRGDHVLEVRAFDGVEHWGPVSVGFYVNQWPVVTIEDHVDGDRYLDHVEFSGTASDDGRVEEVYARVDEGGWVLLMGTESWTHSVDVKGLVEGEHGLDVRAIDDDGEMTVVSTTFRLTRSEKVVSGDWTVVAMVIVVVLLLMATAMFYRQRQLTP
jgi:beta propeller repeat protein